MLILIFSDSHRYLGNLREVMYKLKDSVEHIVFLGDIYNDIETLIYEFPQHSFHVVLGNNDCCRNLPKEVILEIGGKKIFITHGNEFFVEFGTESIVKEAIKHKVDICLFGHTHCPSVFYESDILFMNPGSISFPRKSKVPSYGILKIEEDGKVSASIVGKYEYGYSPMDIYCN